MVWGTHQSVVSKFGIARQGVQTELCSLTGLTARHLSFRFPCCCCEQKGLKSCSELEDSIVTLEMVLKAT